MIKILAAQHQVFTGLCIAVLLSACVNQTAAPPITGTPDTSPTATDLPALDPWLSNPALTRAAELLKNDDTALAVSILSQLDRSKLSADEHALYTLLNARALDREGNSEQALNIIEQALLEQATMDGLELQPQVRQRLQTEQLSILMYSGRGLRAARQASGWLASASDDYASYLTSTVWSQLQLLPISQLEQERALSIEQDWLGWLDLTLLVARVSDSPAVQVAALKSWQLQYPQHRYAIEPPPGLATLPELAAATPRRVALVLPLSGPLTRAGQAVLDGYLAALHAARQRDWPSSELIVLDSRQFPSALDAYREALGRGAELVIGPLTKERLPQQAPAAALPVPWLALNWLPASAGGFPDFYQFALSPEDEAAQLAELAWADGARSALLIHPEGDWGYAVASPLRQRWGQLHGDLRGVATYSDSSDYSKSIKTALNLAESERRAGRVRQIMSTEIEFTPRRRQDVDVVFLLSGKPQEARSIKPLIAFHFASDLPVYSTSHVYSGKPDPQRDRDLNGIRMLEMPWLLTPGPVRAGIEAESGAQSLAAMYALGNDAYLLHWRLPALAGDTASSVRGATGRLSMDSNGRIHRRLLAATFSRGTPKARAP